ncbi:MAG: type II toxin-antitoxin system RelE/ParE family toxin [Flavobacteriales bacterium]|nr:type II toxin-antitoxin system RelE/ParE family toxin [Flavobacteriales bacterium]
MKLVITDPAWESLDRAVAFMSERWSDTIIDRVVAELWDNVRVLLQFPGGGQVEEDLAFLGQGHRRIVVGHFKVIYFVAADTVYITDFFDSRQDPERMLP